MISTPDRRRAVKRVEEARAQGASQAKACAQLEISARTYQRWTREGGVKDDARPDVERPSPADRLSEAEREQILAVCNRPEYAHLPPSQIVPMLADEGAYLASESSFYRVLREAGRFYRLYPVLDSYSRKIVGWERHERESAELAAQRIQRACLAEGITRQGLVLHSDNGSPMKGATLQRLGVVPSFSRPSVSNDNPYSESRFGSLKYSPADPDTPFESLEAARAWV